MVFNSAALTTREVVEEISQRTVLHDEHQEALLKEEGSQLEHVLILEGSSANLNLMLDCLPDIGSHDAIQVDKFEREECLRGDVLC